MKQAEETEALEGFVSVTSLDGLLSFSRLFICPRCYSQSFQVQITSEVNERGKSFYSGNHDF